MSIRTRTGRSPASASSRRVASIPSSSGMRMSISTTSGFSAPDLLDGVEAVGGLADDLEVVLGVEDHAEAGAHERLVVGDQQPDAHATLNSRAADGSAARTRQPPPSAGPASSSPP